MTHQDDLVIELWHSNVPIADQLYLNEGLALLSDEQRSQIIRYHRVSDQLLHLAGRLLVKRYMQQGGQPFHWNNWQQSGLGKPFLAAGPSFSLSYAGNRVVAAFSNYPVGVDIEQQQKVDAAALSRYFHPAEQEFIQTAADSTMAFFTLWTRKEALLKAIGIGIAGHLSVHNCLHSQINHDINWYLHSLPSEAGYALALATPLPQFTWRVVEVPAASLLLNS